MGNAEGRAPRRAEPRGNPGSFDELHRLCKEVFPPQMEGVKLIVTKTLSSHFQVTHTVHMSTLGPSGYRFNATFVGDRQLGPTEVFPTLLGDMDSAGSLNAQALQLLGERLRAKAVFQTHQAKFVTWQFDGEYRGDDCTATLTLGNPDLLGGSERHRPPGAGRGARVPPAARRGGGHPHPGRQILGPELGDNAQRGLRGGPRQLLPPGQRAGAGGGGAGGQHAPAGDHLCLWLPAQPAASQRRLQRAPGQQLERGGGPGEEVAPPARDAGPGRLPEPLEKPLPLRLQRHRGLRDRGHGTGDRTAGTGDSRDSRTEGTGQQGQWDRGDRGQRGQDSRDSGTEGTGQQGQGTAGTGDSGTEGRGQQGQGTGRQGQGTAGTAGQRGQDSRDRGQQGHRGQDSRDRTVGTGQWGQDSGDRTEGTGQRGQRGQDSGDRTAGTGQRGQRGQDSGDRTAGTAGVWHCPAQGAARPGRAGATGTRGDTAGWGQRVTAPQGGWGSPLSPVPPSGIGGCCHWPSLLSPAPWRPCLSFPAVTHPGARVNKGALLCARWRPGVTLGDRGVTRGARLS
ncbi:mitochondrial import receptor subunit TOM40B isoform X6 [Vidua chalybeata]|uniref:mitochondrial import receptor subunit TOM40B isoform X6 n=1 Tax=Vidua chalybeata TaxID=81927 RepID=UPI0023A84BBC|nr:mitochondrial import receptor subunit TOM40B isoform X6 [Vidua chalybeata]